MSYLGNSPGVASQRVVTTIIATSGQTTFTPTSGYTLGYADVYFNGVKLVNGDDYTAADGTTIVLASAAAANDVVEVVAHFPRGLSDGYLKSEADARYPRVDVNTQSLTSTQKGNARTNIGAQADLGYTPVNKAGDTMSGPLKIVYSGMASPPSSTDLSAAAGFSMTLGGGDYFAIGQYSNSKIWLQGAYGPNPSLGKYNLVLQPLGGNVETGGSLLVAGANSISGARVVARGGAIAATTTSDENSGVIVFATRIISGTNTVIAQATGINSATMITASVEYQTIYSWDTSTNLWHGKRMAGIRSSTGGGTTATQLNLGNTGGGSGATEPGFSWTGTTTLNLNLSGASSNEGIAIVTIAWRSCALTVSPVTA